MISVTREYRLTEDEFYSLKGTTLYSNLLYNKYVVHISKDEVEKLITVISTNIKYPWCIKIQDSRSTVYFSQYVDPGILSGFC